MRVLKEDKIWGVNALALVSFNDFSFFLLSYEFNNITLSKLLMILLTPKRGVFTYIHT